MNIRAATLSDAPAILSLLRVCNLPTEGVPDANQAIFVTDGDGQLDGVVGLELHGPYGLLRSLAVAPNARGRGIATQLCNRVEATAQAFELRGLFILTETAREFFAKRGYHAVERQFAPAEITASSEFVSVCPQSALLMQYDLSDRLPTDRAWPARSVQAA